MTRRFSTTDLENMLDDVPLHLLIGHSRKPIIERRKVIADYHRVRTELEALRDHARDVRGHESTANDITRILGDNNE